MRPVREITTSDENFRIEPIEGTNTGMIRRDSVKPEPVGTIVLMAFRVTGYDMDCDGSLMARMEHINRNCEATGWAPSHLGLYPDTNLVVTADEWHGMFNPTKN